MPDFTEVDGWPRWEEGQNDFQGERKLLSAWDDAEQIADDIVHGFDGFGEVFPYKPSAGARARSARVEGFGRSKPGTGSKIIAYDWAHILVTYRTHTGASERPVASGSGFTGGIIERFEPTPEMQVMDFEQFAWADRTPLRENEAPAVLRHGMNYVLTRTRQPNVDPTIFLPTGGVNATSYQLYTFGLTFPAETMLYNQPTITHNFNTRSGSSTFDTTWRLSIKFPGWNVYWRPEIGLYSRIVKKSNPLSNVENYPLVEFGNI